MQEEAEREQADAEREQQPINALPPLIRGLLQPEAYPHPVQQPIRCLQTHISWVLLTGGEAYKIRKPVNLGFLDFTTLEQRRRDCLEELRLNRRLNGQLYKGLVAIGGSAQQPRIEPLPTADGDAEPAAQPAALEYAVQMREFPQRDLLPAALARGEVSSGAIEALADRLARFHATAAIAAAAGPYGTPAAVRQPVLANIACLEPRLAPELRPQLAQLQRWEASTFAQLTPHFQARLAAGRVRECHGDLHLGNLLLRQGQIQVFDCLEFNPELRWIDVISDMAFLVMDLEEQGAPGLANRLLNRWLEWSGDYAGLELWRWYVSYRAMVRAKVAALSGDRRPDGDVAAYLQLALRQQQPPRPWLLLCHGVSGSGKSHLSGAVAAELGAIRLRSDVERKRWFGRWGDPALACRSGDPYAPAVSAELFGEQLPRRAEQILRAGFAVIIDATFLQQAHREPMTALAARLGVPLVILDLQTPDALVRQRLQQRLAEQRRSADASEADPSDADVAVLEQQLQQRQPLSAAERQRSIAVSPEQRPAAVAATVAAAVTAAMAAAIGRSLGRDE